MLKKKFFNQFLLMQSSESEEEAKIDKLLEQRLPWFIYAAFAQYYSPALSMAHLQNCEKNKDWKKLRSTVTQRIVYAASPQ